MAWWEELESWLKICLLKDVSVSACRTCKTFYGREDVWADHSWYVKWRFLFLNYIDNQRCFCFCSFHLLPPAPPPPPPSSCYQGQSRGSQCLLFAQTISWTAEPVVTRLSMLVYHRVVKVSTEKTAVLYAELWSQATLIYSEYNFPQPHLQNRWLFRKWTQFDGTPS